VKLLVIPTTYKRLTQPEKDERMKNLHDVVRSEGRRIQSLQKKVSDLIQEEGVDASIHNDLLTIMKKLMMIVIIQRHFLAAAAQSSYSEGLSLHAMSPSNNSVVSLPSPPFQWLLQHLEKLRCSVITFRENS